MGLSVPLLTFISCLLPYISNAAGSIDAQINAATQAGFSFEVDSDPPMNPTAQIFYMVTNGMTSTPVPTPIDVRTFVNQNPTAPCSGSLNVASAAGKSSVENTNFVEVRCKLDATTPYKLWIASDLGAVGMPLAMVQLDGYDLLIQDCPCQRLCGVNCCVGTDICVTDFGVHFCVAPDKVEHWRPVPFANAIPGNPCAALAQQKHLLARRESLEKKLRNAPESGVPTELPAVSCREDVNMPCNSTPCCEGLVCEEKKNFLGQVKKICRAAPQPEKQLETTQPVAEAPTTEPPAVICRKHVNMPCESTPCCEGLVCEEKRNVFGHFKKICTPVPIPSMKPTEPFTPATTNMGSQSLPDCECKRYPQHTSAGDLMCGFGDNCAPKSKFPKGCPPKAKFCKKTGVTENTASVVEPGAVTFKIVGKGWCRPSKEACAPSAQKCGMAGFRKRKIKAKRCKRVCELRAECVGYATNTKKYRGKSKWCAIYGVFSEPLNAKKGWEPLQGNATSFGEPNGDDDHKCVRKNQPTAAPTEPSATEMSPGEVEDCQCEGYPQNSSDGDLMCAFGKNCTPKTNSECPPKAQPCKKATVVMLLRELVPAITEPVNILSIAPNEPANILDGPINNPIEPIDQNAPVNPPSGIIPMEISEPMDILPEETTAAPLMPRVRPDPTANPCVCKNTWRDPASGGVCKEEQSGCPKHPCDGDKEGRWCVTTEGRCSTALEGGSWARCDDTTQVLDAPQTLSWEQEIHVNERSVSCADLMRNMESSLADHFQTPTANVKVVIPRDVCIQMGHQRRHLAVRMTTHVSMTCSGAQIAAARKEVESSHFAEDLTRLMLVNDRGMLELVIGLPFGVTPVNGTPTVAPKGTAAELQTGPPTTSSIPLVTTTKKAHLARNCTCDPKTYPPASILGDHFCQFGPEGCIPKTFFEGHCPAEGRECVRSNTNICSSESTEEFSNDFLEVVTSWGMHAPAFWSHCNMFTSNTHNNTAVCACMDGMYNQGFDFADYDCLVDLNGIQHDMQRIIYICSQCRTRGQTCSKISECCKGHKCRRERSGVQKVCRSKSKTAPQNQPEVVPYRPHDCVTNPKWDFIRINPNNTFDQTLSIRITDIDNFPWPTWALRISFNITNAQTAIFVSYLKQNGQELGYRQFSGETEELEALGYQGYGRLTGYLNWMSLQFKFKGFAFEDGARSHLMFILKKNCAKQAKIRLQRARPQFLISTHQSETLFMAVSCVAVLVGFLLFCVVLGKRLKRPGAHSNYSVILDDSELDAIYTSHACQKVEPREYSE